MNRLDRQKLMSVHYAKQLISFRRSQDLTQEDLAEVLGVTAATISRWENEAQSPDPEHLILIEKLFGTQKMNSLEEWSFRVNRSAGYEILFDEPGNVVAASPSTLALSGLTHKEAVGLKAFQLLPGSAAIEAEAEYRRRDYFSHRSKLFTGEMRLVQFTAELRITCFSHCIAGEYWPVIVSGGKTFVLFTFFPVGSIPDSEWLGEFRILSYQVWPMIDPIFAK